MTTRRLQMKFCRAVALVVLATLAAGCEPRLENDYGQRNGFEPKSVNGTAVLGEMFQQAGHHVSSWRVLSPRLGKHAECIVWFPDSLDPPRREVREWLDQWLTDQPNRTLIYVGRDFDAEPGYWQKILPLAPAGQQAEIQRRLAEAQGRAQIQHLQSGAAAKPAPGASSPPVDSQRWFDFRNPTPGPPEAYRFSPAWRDVFDPQQAEIELHTRIKPRGQFRTLVGRGNDMIVARSAREGSQLLLVVNGSFLLNLPLVNHEHRKLAARLIEQVGPAGQDVVFLESGRGGPPIRTQDRDPGPPSGVEVLTIWPTNWILLHAIAVGMIACAWRWRIFGLPRPAPQEPPSDFGRHIAALGELLRRSGDRGFARSRLQQYRQQTEAGQHPADPDANPSDTPLTPNPSPAMGRGE